ncbi:glycosyltransferase family 4 protein [Erwinia billingiae]|uniref:glycosyltransferase family 4 protein n=1 Tax=Erwinia billingiae TaxID=182337 RepID=UPI000CFEAF9C|nr:glycosyltransferase family 4 protein [Erwinia billingiae]PRB58154.1 glycosyl transferase [Erwinia billingiae]
MIIGLANNAYPEKRCITCIDTNTFVNLKKNNVYLYLNYVDAKLGKTQPNYLFRSFLPLSGYRLDLLHFFNHIPMTNKKWVVSFETAIPRIRENITSHRVRDVAELPPANAKTEKVLKLVAQDNCIALIAISQCAYDIQMAVLSAYPSLMQKIAAKVKVVHPPQKLLANTKEPFDQKVNFLFVGKDFYRKGGAEVILAFSDLLEEGSITAEQFTLTVVGDTGSRHNYLHGKFQDTERFHSDLNAKMLAMSCLKVHQSMPNKDVIATMLRSDIGLLPTWGDTYGYSVLEMQSCGCPVISTNVRALPEINGPEAGWQIDLKLNRFGELLIDSEEDKYATRKKIIDSLKDIITEAVRDRAMILQKAQNAIMRIKEEHDPLRYKETINAIYTQSPAKR